MQSGVHTDGPPPERFRRFVARRERDSLRGHYGLYVLFVSTTSTLPKVWTGDADVPLKTFESMVTLWTPKGPSSQFCSGSISRFWLAVLAQRVRSMRELLRSTRSEPEPPRDRKGPPGEGGGVRV